MGMSGTYGHAERSEAIAAIHAAIDAGVTLIDTAEIYGPIAIPVRGSPTMYGFENESLVGEALLGKRDKVVMATKIGFAHDDKGRRIGQDGSPAQVCASVDGCLSRLRTDHIDLLYLHRVDPKVPVGETVGAMASLVAAGKVGHIGLSEASYEAIEAASAVHPIVAQQCEYSLWERAPEEHQIGFCAERGIGFVAFAPLGRGFLAGNSQPAETYPDNDYRRLEPRLQRGNFEANLAIADKIRSMADGKGVSPAQLAIAWAISRGAVAIPGAPKPGWALENAAAADVRLTAEEMDRLDHIAPLGATAGPRFAGEWAKQVAHN
jgi:aryl-alcohol dehydrogenase-like predicted oxidoreductase